MRNKHRRGGHGLGSIPGASGRARRRSISSAVEALELRFMLSAGPGIRPADATGVPPSVAISAPNVTSTGQTDEVITLTFTDNAGIDPTSINNNNITVTNQSTGVGLTVTSSSLNPSDGSGTKDVATYHVATPSGGAFTSDQNGTYSVVLGLNQVYDPNGDAAAQTAGAFNVNVTPSGATAPTATITPPPTVNSGIASVSVSVTYAATSGGADVINAATITPGNIKVTGPAGTLAATAVSVSPSGGNAATLTATYTVAAPSGAFTIPDNGVYTIVLDSSHPVLDSNSLAAAASPSSTTFTVALPTELTAVFSATPEVTAAQPSEAISIVYTDTVGINLTTITPANIVVTEQGVANPTPLTVTGVSLSQTTGTPTLVTATYTVAAPNSTFAIANDGTYTVTLQANQVEDLHQQFAAPQSSSFVVNVAGTVSLLPTLGRLKLPASIAGGAKLRLSVPVTVTNAGTIASSGTSTVTLFASTTQGLTGATQVASVTSKLHIKPRKAAKLKVKLNSLPATLQAGAYYFVVEVTDANGVSAIAVSSSAVAVAPPFIDLSGSLRPVPAVLKLGKKTSVTVVVTNGGNVPAAGSLQVQLLARPSGTTGSADVPLATPASRINIAPRASRKLRLSFVLPQTLTAGTSYSLVAVLDPGNVFNDSNPANNTLVATSSFTVA